MTKTEIFKSAHKMARKVVAIVGDYMVALAYSLKEVYKNMTVKTVETYRGMRKIDIKNKQVENNDGEMVTFTKVVMRAVDGKQYAMYIHEDGKSATALTLSAHKYANELSDAQKSNNLIKQRVDSLNHEQYIR
ncbi:TPA: hypothetical protein ACX6QP_002180 [Photobacterium damselae]